MPDVEPEVRVYLRVARETMRLDRPTTPDELRAAFHRRLAVLRLLVDYRADDALSVVLYDFDQAIASQRIVDVRRRSRRRHRPSARPRVTLPDAPPPLSQTAAVALLSDLKAHVRAMPVGYGVGRGEAMNRARRDAALAKKCCPRCAGDVVIVSRVKPGWLFCSACHHRWEMRMPKVAPFPPTPTPPTPGTRSWERCATPYERCGLCGRAIAQGAQMLRISLHGVKRPKYRCVDCAGEQPDTPA